MKNKTLFKGMLAVTAASLIGTAAHATTSTLQGDLVLTVAGDNSYSGTGSGDDLEFDLGSFTKFEPGGADFTLGGTTTIAALNTADIATVFGASWDAQTDLVWDAAATNYTDTVDYPGLPENTVFGTQNRTTHTGSGDPAGTAQGPAGLINDMVSGLNGQSQVFNSSSLLSSDAAVLATSDGSSFNGDSGNASPYFGTSSDLNTHFTQATNGTTVDYLYEYQPGTVGTELGYFTLSNSNLTYTAVPEPSTWASLVIGAAALIGIRFRRRRA
jgi:hypothetical protein